MLNPPTRVVIAGDGSAGPRSAHGPALACLPSADVAAEDIAASAGATVEPRWFDSLDRGKLAGLPFGGRRHA